MTEFDRLGDGIGLIDLEFAERERTPEQIDQIPASAQ
jgi:hypothetical protein